MKKLITVLSFLILSIAGFGQIDLSQSDSIGSATTPVSGVPNNSYFWMVNEGATTPKSRRISLYQIPRFILGSGFNWNSTTGRIDLGGPLTSNVTFTGAFNFTFPQDITATLGITGNEVTATTELYASLFNDNGAGFFSFTDDIYPSITNTYTLGSPSFRWASIWTSGLDLNNNLINNVLTPVSSNDAATKGYVDANKFQGSYTNEDVSNNTIIDIVTFDRETSGTALAGIGGYVSIGVEGADGTVSELRLEHELTDVTTASEESTFRVTGTTNGTPGTTYLEIGSNGGGGSFFTAIGAGAVSSTSSFAGGRSAAASAANTVAIGPFATASSASAISIGNLSDATNTSSVAIGALAQSTSTSTIAIGNGAEALATEMIAIGTDAGDNTIGADGIGAVSIGNQANSTAATDIGINAIAIGTSAVSLGQETIVMGHLARADGVGGIALGLNALSPGNGGVSIGRNSDVTLASVAVGDGAQGTGSNSVAIGITALGTGNNSVAVGQNTIAANSAGVSIGIGAETNANNSIAIGNDAGDNTTGTDGASSVSIGNQSNSVATQNIGTGSIAIGNFSNTSAQGAILIGYHTSAQTNGLSDSFELAWDGTRGFKVGNTFGTQVTNVLEPSTDLTDAEEGALAWDTDNNELEVYNGIGWQTVDVGSSLNVVGTTDNGLFTYDNATGDLIVEAGATFDNTNGLRLAKIQDNTSLGLVIQNTSGSTVAEFADGGSSSLTTDFFGDVTIGNGSGATDLIIDGAAGNDRGVYLKTGGTNRFIIGVDNGSESGSNAGSDFFIGGYNDGGTPFGTDHLRINRGTGVATFGTTVATQSLNVSENASIDGYLRFNQTPVEVTIATGTATISDTYHVVDTESDAATDDLETLAGTAVTAGAIIILRAANSARTVVLKDGVGNLQLNGDFSLDNVEDTIMLLVISGSVLELSRSDNGL